MSERHEVFARASEEWDRRYGATPRVFRAEPDETLVELVSPLAPGQALDLGAGEGRNSLWLAKSGWTVVAVDASQVALDRLAEFAAADGVTIEAVHGDIIDYLRSTRATGRHFDLVILAYLHPSPEERAALLDTVVTSLSTNGHLFIVGHHVSSLGMAGPPDPSRLYSEEDLRGAVQDLEVLRLERRGGASDVSEPGVDVVLWASKGPRSQRG